MYTENFSCDATNGQQWSRDGAIRCIRYESGYALGAVPRIRVRPVTGSGYDCELVPGRTVTLPADARGVVITNLSGAASLVGKISIGQGAITDNDIVGEVATVNGGVARTLAGAAFMGGSSLFGAAATFTHVQLWNHPGSGKNLVVNSIIADLNTGSSGVALRVATVALATMVLNPASKLLGGAASVAEVRTEQPAAAIAGTALNGSLYLLANSPFKLDCQEQVIVPPGFGINVINLTANTHLTAQFDFYERAIST